MRLKYQLFLILLMTGGLLIALMAAISSWSFDRGFIGYINQTERQRLDPLVDALELGYAREGDWRWLTEDRKAWDVLLGRYLGYGRAGPPGGLRRGPRGGQRGRSSGGPPGGPPGGSLEGRGSEGPPLGQRRLDGLAVEPGVRPERLPRPRNDGDSTLTLDPRLLLSDAGKTVLIGRERSDRKVTWQSVIVDNTTVGYLGYHERTSLPGQLDKAFASQQRRSFLYAALAMVLLSVLIAVVLAGRLVRPLLIVKDAVARIGDGQYAHRVPEQRSDEIGDLSRSINTLASTLEKNLDARRQWLAEISHELRTPVAVLQSELEAIQDGVNPLDEAAITSLHSETLRLARLIDDLHDLTLSDVGALDYRFEPLELGQVLSQRMDVASNYPSASALSIELIPSDSPIWVNGDEQRLAQLVDNLLQNSYRYTDAGGEVRVTLSRVGNQAVIDWSDSKPGVEDAQLARLFEPLYRADASRNRGNGGAGLGLSIVQRVVEAHGGTITAGHSSLGGLAMRIALPLAQEQDP